MRWIVSELELIQMPRSSFRLEPVGTHQWKITNLHKTARVSIRGVREMRKDDSQILAFPATIQVQGAPFSFFIEHNVNKDEHPGNMGEAASDGRSKREILRPSSMRAEIAFDPQMTMTQFTVNRSSVEADQQMRIVLEWIEHAIQAMQRPVSSVDFFSGIACTVAKIIELDRAEIVLWEGGNWDFDESRRYVSPQIDKVSQPSISLLNEVLRTKRIVVVPDDSGNLSPNLSDSVLQLHTAIACPILNMLENGNSIRGVLYADRKLDNILKRSKILEPEQKLIEILAMATASSLARMKRETEVIKYQQFFSPKITEAISRNPKLLEGDDAEVSVLFCDIRGFSKATDIIGAEKAMEWISDTLSELSAIVLESDGVLVDYVGDEMFAMWGAPDPSNNHAFTAAMAALAMMDLRSVLNERYGSSIPGGVDFGIGICTGLARVGNTGSKQKFKYGPMGRTVNLGSRIQGLTKQWKVSAIIDENTASCLPADLGKRRLCMAEVVGLEGYVKIYELMPNGLPNAGELSKGYTNALELFESGKEFRGAVRGFGELVQKFPTDAPSLMMLVRSVNELVEPSESFSPVWKAKTK